MPASIFSRNRGVRPFLSAEWRYLAMMNFRIEPAVLEPFVPRGTRLDLFQGETFVSLVGFLFRDTKVLGVSVPRHRDFEELNLRFYVVREVDGEFRRGVVFIKELAPRWAVCTIARVLYNENYVCLPMRHQLAGFTNESVAADDGPMASETRQVKYEWKTWGRWHSLYMNVSGPAEPLIPGSHEEFIAEHYWGYSRQRDGGTFEYRVDHPRWRVWRDAAAALDCDVERLYGAPFADLLTKPHASAFVAEGSAITVSHATRIH